MGLGVRIIGLDVMDCGILCKGLWDCIMLIREKEDFIILFLLDSIVVIGLI